jgi:O-antigen/teichoic acid export membrane protein
MWIGVAQILHAAAGHAALLLSMGMRQGTMVWCQTIGLGTNVLLGLFLIPTHGATGAAIALAAGIVVVHGAALVAARAHFGFDMSLIGAVRMLLRP